MIERLIDWSARNKFFVFLLSAIAIALGLFGIYQTPLDAIPDLSDVQVIVYTDWEGRSPDLMEDQVTYPISSLFIAAPKVKFVRGESMFGKSFVYVIFEDGTDIYWARSRVLEYLNSIRGSLPEGVNPVLGPDATGVGWVYEYALVDDSGKHDLAELRSLQDWNLRYALEAVKGVAEVAPVGGFVKEYQVDLDPNALAAHRIPLSDVVGRIRASNNDVGGKTFEVGSTEYYVRGRGYIKSVADIENVVLKVDNGTPVYVRNVGTVHLGPAFRRGVADLDGKGEVVGGIVVMRYGENALRVIDGVKSKLAEIKSSLPPGVRIVPTYDRSDLIRRAISTLREKLIEETPRADLRGIAGDLSTAAGVQSFVKEAPEADILINNLGIFEPKPFAEIPDADWLRFFEVNVMSGVRLSRQYLPGMQRKNWGRIIFISSESGQQIPAEMIHYGMTKTAQIAIARGLAESVAGTGITVNSVLVGPTASEGVGTFVEDLAKQQGISKSEFEKTFFASVRPSSLLKRFETPEEVAAVVAFVASAQATTINGAAVRADGGVVRSIL